MQSDQDLRCLHEEAFDPWLLFFFAKVLYQRNHAHFDLEKYLSACNRTDTYELGHEKMCLMSYANNKGADQTAYPCSLISAFVVRCLDSIISLDSIAEISRL